MAVTFEQARAIVADELKRLDLSGVAQDYGADLGDAWIPTVTYDDIAQMPLGGVIAVRKSDGVIYGEVGNPFHPGYREGAPVGNAPPDEGSADEDDDYDWNQ